MPFTYGFYNSSNGDRVYDATQMSQIFDGIITDGVYAHVGDHFNVVPTSGTLGITVRTGRAWFDHTWNYLDEPLSLPLAAAPLTKKRIDAVVLEVNATIENRQNSIKIITGTEATTPVKPELIDEDDVHQHALAYVTVTAGVTAITSSSIEYVVGTSETPYSSSVLESINIDAHFAQWDAQFREWWDELKYILDEETIGRIYNRINEVEGEVNTVASTRVQKAGDTMTGFLTLHANPTNAMHAATKGYADNVGGAKVGDVKTSMNPNQPDWLLCNGYSFTSAAAPQLTALIGENFKYQSNTDDSKSTAHGSGRCVYEDDQFIIYGGTYINSNDYGSPKLTIWDKTNGTLSTKNFSTGGNTSKSSDYNNISNVRKFNGAYIAVGTIYRTRDGSSKNLHWPIVLYTTDPTGIWTLVYLDDVATHTAASGKASAYDVFYENGYYYVAATDVSSVGSSDGNLCIYKSTSLSGPWTKTTVTTESTSCSKVLKIDDYYLICTRSGGVFYYATNLSGPWTKKTIADAGAILGIKKIGTQFIAYGGDDTSVGSTSRISVSVSNSITGTWTHYEGNPSTANHQAVLDIAKIKNKWVLLYAYFVSATSSSSASISFVVRYGDTIVDVVESGTAVALGAAGVSSLPESPMNYNLFFEFLEDVDALEYFLPSNDITVHLYHTPVISAGMPISPTSDWSSDYSGNWYIKFR